MATRPQGMPCPIDGTQLVMSERQGIEIDYCPSCRGVWLDRGELDKIVERATAESAPAPAPAAQPAPHAAPQAPPPQASPWGAPQAPHGYGQPGYGQPGYGHNPYGYRKRKKSFLEELFD